MDQDYMLVPKAVEPPFSPVELPEWSSERTDRLMPSNRSDLRWIYRPRQPWRLLRRIGHYLLLVFGSVYLALIIHSLLEGLFPDTFKWISSRWPPTPMSSRAIEGSDIYPIACHSHNDYWRERPLFTALQYGCSSIEADVWLGDNDTLLVGHVPRALSPERTLAAMYLEPLVQVLDEANPEAIEIDRYKHHHLAKNHGLNGVFNTDPTQDLVFMIDFKSDGDELWPLIYDSLDILRLKGYLTHWNGTTVVRGPVTIVVSGNAPFQNIIENEHYRDIFFDAPLELMSALTDTSNAAAQEVHPSEEQRKDNDDPLRLPWLDPTNPTSYDRTNSYYASVSFKRSIGYPNHSKLTPEQMLQIREQIRGAHAQGLVVRYWGVPSWPLGIRNYLWRVLVREGVDILSVDHVEAVATEDWGPRKGGSRARWWT